MDEQISSAKMTLSPRAEVTARAGLPDGEEDGGSNSEPSSQSASKHASSMPPAKSIVGKMLSLNKKLGGKCLVVAEVESNIPDRDSVNYGIDLNQWWRRCESVKDVNGKTAVFLPLSRELSTCTAMHLYNVIYKHSAHDYVGFFVYDHFTRRPMFIQIDDVGESDIQSKDGKRKVIVLKCRCKDIGGYTSGNNDPDIRLCIKDKDGKVRNVFEAHLKHDSHYDDENSAYKCLSIDKSSFQSNYNSSDGFFVSDEDIEKLKQVNDPVTFIIDSVFALFDVIIEDVKVIRTDLGWLIILEARDKVEEGESYWRGPATSKRYLRRAMTGSQIVKALENSIARGRGPHVMGCVLRARAADSDRIGAVFNFSTFKTEKLDDILDPTIGWQSKAEESKTKYHPTVYAASPDGNKLDDKVWSISVSSRNGDPQLCDMSKSGGTSVKKQSLVY